MNTVTKAEHFLDITEFVCPMTFVHTKLLVERIPVGATAEIRLNAGEPLKNVPRSLKEHGHEVLSLAPEPGAGEAGPYRLLLRKR
jgi:TusA-related sulfurtransferase